MKNDIHHHFIPQALRRYVSDLPEWTEEGSIDFLDRHGLKKACLSLSYHDITFASEDEYVKFCRDANEELAETVARRPDRFDAFGVLPFPHVEASIAELDRCVEEYGFAGVVLYTNVRGEYPSFRDHEALFAAFNKRKATLFIHPGTAPLINGESYSAVSLDIEIPQDVTRLVCRFLVEDGFERYPDISYVLGHGGGMLPYNYDRIGKLVYMKSAGGKLALRVGRLLHDLITKRYKIDEYVQSVTIDLYDSSGPEQLAALEENIDRDAWRFGSNFPYASNASGASAIDTQ